MARLDKQHKSWLIFNQIYRRISYVCRGRAINDINDVAERAIYNDSRYKATETVQKLLLVSQFLSSPLRGTGSHMHLVGLVGHMEIQM